MLQAGTNPPQTQLVMVSLWRPTGPALEPGWQAAPIRLLRRLVLDTGVQDTARDLGRPGSSTRCLREVVPLSLSGFHCPRLQGGITCPPYRRRGLGNVGVGRGAHGISCEEWGSQGTPALGRCWHHRQHGRGPDKETEARGEALALKAVRV